MKITIIGCGYIGLALAQKLHQKNHFLTCTTKNPASIKKFADITQKSLVMKGSDKNEMSLLIEENDIIIITVDAKNKDELENTFLQTAYTIKACATQSVNPKRIIYTSKASIYGDHSGMWVDESAPLKAKDEESKILIDAEKVLFSLVDLGWSLTILRLSQIYGPNREIEDRFKENYKDVIAGHGNYYTNMIHRDDVVGVIDYVIDHDIKGIYNVADDDHMTRLDLAKKICSKLNLKVPKYDPKLADFPDNNKRVANYRIKEKGYDLKHPTRII